MYSRRVVISILLIVLGFSLLVAKEKAVWDVTTVCDADEKQSQAVVISVGNGNSIVAWCDYRDNIADIYAQKYNSDGEAQWDSNGIIVSVDSLSDCLPNIASDGTCGVYISWHSESPPNGTNPKISIQKIEANGDLTWGSGPIDVGTAENTAFQPGLLTDDNGGVFVTWYDSSFDLYAMRIDVDGDTLWGPTILAHDIKENSSPRIIDDGGSGAIVSWLDERYSGSDLHSIFTQKIDEDGVIQWDVDGELLYRTGWYIRSSYQLASDDSSGAVVIFARNEEIIIQRINGDGYCPWGTTGIRLSSSSPKSSEFESFSNEMSSCTTLASASAVHKYNLESSSI